MKVIDVMRPAKVSLAQNASLAQVVDAFLQHHLNMLTIVDVSIISPTAPNATIPVARARTATRIPTLSVRHRYPIASQESHIRPAAVAGDVRPRHAF